MDTKKLNTEAELEEILEEPEEEPEKNGVLTYTLRKPQKYNGQTFKELHFNFDGVNGKTCLQIEREMQRLGLVLMAPELSTDYHIRFAVQACAEKIGTDFIESLPAKDFNAIRRMARNFLTR